ncbi:unnamed protein product [Rhizoctonia solani]|uniref:Uncharacterized protein n=3 Tax=Rhizoctonia solani TaxID=456999 RepID=A0A8H3HHW9_9AGAM|nr:hypothetical protein RSOL_381410 [Rhizoctonia solani AG-3 Rhs1AP]KEP54082.1 hypothetical protein V565_022450 [Rhizoctonia solani 123E]CAE6349222.1 unnamed protein product [Rhizoctonia solani]CAE6533220.1 unnamed protein product [Rhizoctonia solani]
MSYPYNNDSNSSDNEIRRNNGYDASEADARGLHTEAGRNAMNHFNNAAEGVGRATAEFNSGGGRDAVESVGNPLANRNEGEGERTNPFLRPAQMLAEATQEGLKGIPGAIFEFATGQYEAHKVHPGGNQRDQEQSESRRD